MTNISFDSHLVFRVTFLKPEQLWAKFQIFIRGQCPELHGEITFFATKVENVKNGGLKIKSLLNTTLWVNKQFSEYSNFSLLFLKQV